MTPYSNVHARFAAAPAGMRTFRRHHSLIVVRDFSTACHFCRRPSRADGRCGATY